MGDMRQTHAETMKWVERSAAAGRPWFVCLDEIGPADTGVKPDADDPEHDDVRRQALWGNLMAGGAGVRVVLRLQVPPQRPQLRGLALARPLWDQTHVALEFFQQHLPFAEMQPADELCGAKDDWCLAKPGEVYAVYLPAANGQSTLKIERRCVHACIGTARTGRRTGRRHARVALKGPGDRNLGEPPTTQAKIGWCSSGRWRSRYGRGHEQEDNGSRSSAGQDVTG